MEVRFVSLDLARLDAQRMEMLALPFFEDERPLRGAAGLCDWRLCGALSRIVGSERVRGDVGEVLLVPGRPRLAFEKVVLFGQGPAAAFDGDVAAVVLDRVLRTLDGLRLRSMALSLPGRGSGRAAPAEAMRWFLRALESAPDIDEVLVVDDLEAQRAMVPVIEAARRG